MGRRLFLEKEVVIIIWLLLCLRSGPSSLRSARVAAAASKNGGKHENESEDQLHVPTKMTHNNHKTFVHNNVTHNIIEYGEADVTKMN